MHFLRFNTVNGKYCCNKYIRIGRKKHGFSFNTVNGKYCCNIDVSSWEKALEYSFNTVNGKYCCNLKEVEDIKDILSMFQYRKR